MMAFCVLKKNGGSMHEREQLAGEERIFFNSRGQGRVLLDGCFPVKLDVVVCACFRCLNISTAVGSSICLWQR